ncbi:hypothetical protein [Halolamina salifodinae]|uniref:Uncharacterized protein n=1 Tax=Halolamina salifodinae TaxID=1202767 RepID=A0A8T4GXL7_9EURY|nr:hypothetical protein [Halolamina salifodinae]MBP1986843.1 hypothetical protein [Halolamina salifodinae]
MLSAVEVGAGVEAVRREILLPEHVDGVSKMSNIPSTFSGGSVNSETPTSTDAEIMNAGNSP